MIETAHILEVLFGAKNSLWRRDTQHEAMLLMATLYNKNPEAREHITAAILRGPPEKLLKQEDRGESKERDIFEMLAFLESKEAPLLPVSRRKLDQIKKLHPEWVPAKFPGFAMWVESPPSDGGSSANEMSSIAPEGIVEKIVKSHETVPSSVREVCEAIGVRMGHEPQWGLIALDALHANLSSLPASAINPILWGLRATITDNSCRLDHDGVLLLLDKFLDMTAIDPEPEMWTSLPSLLHSIVDRFELVTDIWNQLATRLASVFQGFDYGRPDEESPIDWRQRAINHPHGDVTELYIQAARHHVNILAAEEKTLHVGHHAEQFFFNMLAHYNVGSRYGLCLLAPWLSWLEAVSPKIAEAMYRDFEWTNDEERPLVAWSGYLWSNTLARSLVNNFEFTYLSAARHYSKLGDGERRQLASHVSAVFWFHPDNVELLFQFASNVNSEIRINLVHTWKQHLNDASPESITLFLNEIVFPYWDWCVRQEFFNQGSASDHEKLVFWELVPFTVDCFPAASTRALQRRSGVQDYLRFDIKSAVNEATRRYPDQLTEFLIGLLDISRYPRVEERGWRHIWSEIRDTGATGLNELENALARKGVSLQDGT